MYSFNSKSPQSLWLTEPEATDRSLGRFELKYLGFRSDGEPHTTYLNCLLGSQQMVTTTRQEIAVSTAIFAIPNDKWRGIRANMSTMCYLISSSAMTCREFVFMAFVGWFSLDFARQTNIIPRRVSAKKNIIVERMSVIWCVRDTILVTLSTKCTPLDTFCNILFQNRCIAFC